MSNSQVDWYKKGDTIKMEVEGRGIVGEIVSTGDEEADLEAQYQFLTLNGHLTVPTQAQRMHEAAYAFAEVLHLIDQPGPQSGRPMRMMIPFVVNCAFSIELLLKTISHAYGRDQRGHKLLKLLAGLPADARADIEKALPSVLQARQMGPSTTIEDLIGTVNTAFEEWRYLFEKPSSTRVEFAKATAAITVLHDVARRKIWPAAE